MIDNAKATFREARGCQTYFVKYFSKSSCDRFAPASVNKTDLAFVAGSEMYSFRCRRSSASQLCPFHALNLGLSSNVVRYSRASTMSSTFSSFTSMRHPLTDRMPQPGGCDISTKRNLDRGCGRGKVNAV